MGKYLSLLSRKTKLRCMGIVILAVISSFLTSVWPVRLGELYTAISNEEIGTIAQVGMAVIEFGMIYLLAECVTIIRRVMLDCIIATHESEIREYSIEKLLKMPVSYYSGCLSGEKTAQLNQGVAGLSQLIKIICNDVFATILIAVCTLVQVLDILDWSQAAFSFVKYGDSDQIVDLYKKNSKRLPSKAIELYKIISELQNITRGLETSRGYSNPELIRKNQEMGQINSSMSSGSSILESYFVYEKSYRELMKKDEEQTVSNQQRNMIKPLGELMNMINDDVQNFNVESNLDLGLAAIKWAIDHKRTQQGFTALEETIKTFLCKYYKLDEVKEPDRELGKQMGNALARQKQKEHARELTQEIREKAYGEWKAWNSRKTNEECQKAYEIIMDIPLEMVETIQNVSQCRNSMNHFGYSNIGQFSGEKLEKNLEKYYYNFIDNMAQMKDKNSRSK